MNLSELYVFVNPQLKEIKGIFQEQPQDSIKICTLPGLEEDQKADLGWANLPEHGFVRGERLKEYSCSDDQMEKIKFDIKKRCNYEIMGLYRSGVVFNDFTFSVDPQSLVFANMQNSRYANFLKDDITWRKFSRDEMQTLVTRMNVKFDSIVEKEIRLHELIDKTSTVYELSQLHYDI